MINAGMFDKRITIKTVTYGEDEDGFKTRKESIVLKTWAHVKTTRGYTLIVNNSDFEKAYTNFTIRYPKVEITRDMMIDYKGKEYSIEYPNDIDKKGTLLEIQAKEVSK